MSVISIKKELMARASAARKKTNERFFKTGPSEYGYGDVFMGVSTPDIRKIAKSFPSVSFSDIKTLLSSKFHEERAMALVMLVQRFEKGSKKTKKQVYDFYLKHFKYVNSWDLVDISAHKIVGEYALKNHKLKSVFSKYAVSKNLWGRRMSIVGTLSMIRSGKFEITMKVASMLLSDTNDLTHKAVGWMLREVWKRDSKIVEDFLRENYNDVSRTTLRYAIERMKEKKRKIFLNLKNQ